jgi:hypothetical protein
MEKNSRAQISKVTFFKKHFPIRLEALSWNEKTAIYKLQLLNDLHTNRVSGQFFFRFYFRAHECRKYLMNYWLIYNFVPWSCIDFVCVIKQLMNNAWV